MLVTLWGAKFTKRIAARLTNQFWKNTLMAFADLQSDFFCNLNFFENRIFKFGYNCIKKADFGLLWGKGIRQVWDLCNCSLEPPQLYSKEDLNRNFNVEIDFLRYKQLKTGIEHGAKSVNNKKFDRHLSDYRTPRLPLLLKCSIAVNKGCSFFIFRYSFTF